MMDDLISRRDAINAVSEITTTMSVCTNKDECYGMKRMQKQAITELANLPSAEPYTTTHDSIPAETGKNDGDRTSGDCISRQAAIEVLRNRWLKTRNYDGIGEDIAEECEIYLKTLPSVQPETNCSEIPNNSDTISRQQALETIRTMQTYKLFAGDDMLLIDQAEAQTELMMLPSAQPERRCVNCGRTVNNGGWYEDGRTRCPIEEHYALPKDGYCHLWEKRKDWEDDYVKRAEEGEK